jgi:hypothetical protein
VSFEKLRYNFASGTAPFDGTRTHEAPQAMAPRGALFPPALPACAMHRIVACTVASDNDIPRIQTSRPFIIELFETNDARLHQFHMLNGLTVNH